MRAPFLRNEESRLCVKYSTQKQPERSRNNLIQILRNTPKNGKMAIMKHVESEKNGWIYINTMIVTHLTACMKKKHTQTTVERDSVSAVHKIEADLAHLSRSLQSTT